MGRRLWAATLLLVLLTGCKVGPNYATPDLSLKPAWSLSNNPRLRGQPADLTEWWHYLQDPYLDKSIDVLLNQNLTLREAGQRIIEARARLGIAQGNLFPQVQNFNGAYTKSKISSNTANFFSAPGIFVPNLGPENWSGGFNASWELDFWGRFRRAIESADANLEAQVAAYDDAMVLLQAEFANTYVQMRTCELRLNLATKNLDLQRRTLELMKEKQLAGVGSITDVAQAQSNVGQTGALRPALETLRRQACHRMCVLMGREPIDLAVEFGATARIPSPPKDLAFGIPADLVRRRPDVRQAERELAAQSARIGIAEADFYPRIGVNGSVGASAQDLSKLFEFASWTGAVAPNFNWSILNYGRIRNNVRAEQAAFARLEYTYRNVVLNAVREAEDAQVGYVYAFERANWLTMAVDGANAAVGEAEKTLREGTTEPGRVYVLQSNLLREQDQLAVSRLDIVTNLIGIFKAMGGGWQIRQKVAAEAGPQQVTDANRTLPSYSAKPELLPPSKPEQVPAANPEPLPPSNAGPAIPNVAEPILPSNDPPPTLETTRLPRSGAVTR